MTKFSMTLAVMMWFAFPVLAQATPIERCGGSDQLEQRSDAVTKIIFSQNYPQFSQDRIIGDGVATPRNWYDRSEKLFHFFRGVTVQDMPVEKEAAFELVYDLNDEACILKT